MGIIFSLVGIKSVSAHTGQFSDTSETSSVTNEAAIAQAEPPVCQYEWQESQAYARIITQEDPLRIRATPGGRVIGAVPKGWAVVVLEVNNTGDWTKITSHFGDPGEFGFASAPSFREGWVASRYLAALGDFCEKPSLDMAAVQLVTGPDAQQYTVQEDWLQMGDRIAQKSRQS
ncbi:MAG: SH3 domain-containing protein [Cyanobacteria bacterium P01_E01_bin.43]